MKDFESKFSVTLKGFSNMQFTIQVLTRNLQPVVLTYEL